MLCLPSCCHGRCRNTITEALSLGADKELCACTAGGEGGMPGGGMPGGFPGAGGMPDMSGASGGASSGPGPKIEEVD